MNTIMVWVLVFNAISTGHNSMGGGPAVIDNIATLEECQRLQKLVRETMPERDPKLDELTDRMLAAVEASPEFQAAQARAERIFMEAILYGRPVDQGDRLDPFALLLGSR